MTVTYCVTHWHTIKWHIRAMWKFSSPLCLQPNGLGNDRLQAIILLENHHSIHESIKTELMMWGVFKKRRRIPHWGLELEMLWFGMCAVRVMVHHIEKEIILYNHKWCMIVRQVLGCAKGTKVWRTNVTHTDVGHCSFCCREEEHLYFFICS